MSVKGNFIGNVSPRTNYNQADPTKADYLEGRDDLDSKIDTARTTAESAKSKANAALPKSGGTMDGAVTTKGIILTSGVDYGDSLPGTVTPGKLFFLRSGNGSSGNGGSGGNPIAQYTGAYQVTPSASGQTLETSQKFMADDITVQAIPFSSVENSAGGTTVTIG